MGALEGCLRAVRATPGCACHPGPAACSSSVALYGALQHGDMGLLLPHVVQYAVSKHLHRRVNSYSGVAYRDDPTIFAWELLEDPRYALKL